MSVVNPQSKRSIKIGSATYNKLVRDGVIKEKKRSVKKVAAKKKSPSPKKTSPKKDEAWVVVSFHDEKDNYQDAFELKRDSSRLYHSKEDAVRGGVDLFFKGDYDEISPLEIEEVETSLMLNHYFADSYHENKIFIRKVKYFD